MALALVAGAAALATPDAVPDRGVLRDAVRDQPHLERLMERHQCSPTGLGPDVIPGSALVRRGDRVRHVTFDDGWATYTGAAPGTLLAVCRTTV